MKNIWLCAAVCVGVSYVYAAPQVQNYDPAFGDVYSEKTGKLIQQAVPSKKKKADRPSHNIANMSDAEFEAYKAEALQKKASRAAARQQVQGSDDLLKQMFQEPNQKPVVVEQQDQAQEGDLGLKELFQDSPAQAPVVQESPAVATVEPKPEPMVVEQQPQQQVVETPPLVQPAAEVLAHPADDKDAQKRVDEIQDGLRQLSGMLDNLRQEMLSQKEKPEIKAIADAVVERLKKDGEVKITPELKAVRD